MEEITRRLGRRLRSSGSNGTNRRKIKKIIVTILITTIIVILLFIGLLIAGVVWFVSQSGQGAQSAITQGIQTVTGQSEKPVNPLDLQSYITNGAVNTKAIQDTYNGLPAFAQSLWLDQFRQQLDTLRQQAGVSDATVKSLTDLFNSLQSQGK